MSSDMVLQATENRQCTRARLLPMSPFSILYGGLELQCVKTCGALVENGISAKLLDYYDLEDEFNVLHLFGSTGNYFEICEHAARKCQIVVSTVSSARSATWLRGRIWNGFSRLARFGHLQTTYERMKAVFHAASAVLCLNQLEADFIECTYDVPRPKIRIVTNGVEDKFFETGSGAFVEQYGIQDFVLFTGNITKRKNPLALARALNRMDLPGVFIGGLLNERHYAAEFTELIDSSPNLVWIPRLGHQDRLLASAYSAASAFCLPSSAETQSLSALEAMASGTPVILGDFPYAHQSPFKSCLKCDPEDERAMIGCLEQAVCQSSASAPQLGDAYRWRSIAGEIAEIYQEVIDESDR